VQAAVAPRRGAGHSPLQARPNFIERGRP
jgi:hypothetical protein